VRRLSFIALILALAACRGEPVPRDYQNQPPAATHPPQKKADSPTAHGMPPAAPEPQANKGAEGQNPTRQPTSPETPSPKLKDQSPATTTT
jgi:hypothetical protein